MLCGEALDRLRVQVRASSVVKLMRLHAKRRVLTAEWDPWIVKPDAIVDPEGNETNRNLLRMYRFRPPLMRRTRPDLDKSTG